jgi:hypothetical protein
MEDAMIINKSAYERGFGHGAVYKSYIREMNETSSLGNGSTAKNRFRMVDHTNTRLKYDIEFLNYYILKEKLSTSLRIINKLCSIII